MFRLNLYVFYGKGDANLSGCSSISCVWLFKLQNFIEISGCNATHVLGVPEKASHSWEPKKLGTSYSETKHLLDLKLRQQRALMSTPCSQSLRPNRCVFSEYEVPNFLGSQ